MISRARAGAYVQGVRGGVDVSFKLCFEDVLIKVSRDASIVSDRRFETLTANAGQYVSTFFLP
jgi:hypothetical protein